MDWRQDDDWDSFNDRNSSLRLRFTGDNGAFDCAYSLHGKHPDSGTCAGPDAWDQCPGGGCWATHLSMHSIYFLLCIDADGQCNMSLTPRQDVFAANPEWFWPRPDMCRTKAQQAKEICPWVTPFSPPRFFLPRMITSQILEQRFRLRA